MNLQIRPTERLRCVPKQPSYFIPAKTWDDFKEIVQKHYSNYDIVFTGIKARIEPFSLFRLKLTWRKI